jgi:hypothetical protein
VRIAASSLGLAQVHERRVELDGEDRGKGDLIDHAILAEDLAEALAAAPAARRGRRGAGRR